LSLWADLISENPMMIEVRRSRRRFFGGGPKGAAMIAVFVLGAIGYLGLLLLIGYASGAFSPLVIVMLQTGIIALAGPSLLNAAIAGEREKRTWDLLLVAPVTRAQILVGKFAGAMSNLLFCAVLFALPIFICASGFARTNLFALGLAEFNSLSFGLFVCGLSLFFSARCRRPFMALAISMGLLLTGLIIYPTLLGGLFGGDQLSGDVAMLLHPFHAQSKLFLLERDLSYAYGTPWDEGYIGISPVIFTMTQSLVFIGLAVVLLVWAERTLNWSDREVKFLPKAPHA